MIFTENINVKIPSLNKTIVEELVDERKYRSISDFVNEAILKLFKELKIDLTPKEVLEEKKWCDF
jgi:Arc/MetJ-type ribon-helix-helix transcriptional regulator